VASASRLCRTLLILPALIASGSTWSAMAQSQGFSNEELARHAIWGMPAVNYDLTFQNGGPRGYGQLQPGHLQCRKRPCGSKHLICTLFRKQIAPFQVLPLHPSVATWVVNQPGPFQNLPGTRRSGPTLWSTGQFALARLR